MIGSSGVDESAGIHHFRKGIRIHPFAVTMRKLLSTLPFVLWVVSLSAQTDPPGGSLPPPPPPPDFPTPPDQPVGEPVIIPGTSASYTQWADSANLPVGRDGPNDDWDGDGSPNLLNYALVPQHDSSLSNAVREGDFLNLVELNGEFVLVFRPNFWVEGIVYRLEILNGNAWVEERVYTMADLVNGREVSDPVEYTLPAEDSARVRLRVEFAR